MDETLNFNLLMSPTVGKIAQAIAKAQKELVPVSKDASNPFFNSKYATLASCLQAVKPLYDYGIAVLQPPVSHGPDGVCVSTLLIHESGEWVRGVLYMPAAKRDPQGFGSALSYARRYCLSATIGLATEDDDGERAVDRTGANRVIKLPEDDPSYLRAQNAIKAAKTTAELDALKERYTNPKNAYTKPQIEALERLRLARMAELG